MNELYGSHLPVLLHLVDVTDGPILELGTGQFSTPLLDLMCRDKKRLLVSVDNDPKWHKENSKWESDFHRVVLLNDWDTFDLSAEFWTIAFVDHKPAKRRRVEIEKLANQAMFVVVHDTEPEMDKFFRYGKAFAKYQFRYDYTKCKPNTTILSNYANPARLFG